MAALRLLFLVTFACLSLAAADSLIPADTEITTEHEHHPIVPPQVIESNITTTNMTLHDEINKALAEDEERVMAGGKVQIRKKRTFCKKCYPSYSYGYGGGGGCCGQCGQCGGGGGYYQRPIKVIKVVKIRPSYGYGGGGGCCSYNPCNVCGR